jgi:predicted RNA binding protein YcfA (HicA-like mRNA interferase family)
VKTPRDLSGEQLVRALKRHGYEVKRIKGSHVRLTHEGPPVHNITIPLHDELKVGLLSSILAEVSEHLGIKKNSVLKK